MTKKIVATIQLDEEEARLFEKFRKVQDAWEKIDQLKPGSLTLHFDIHNKLKKWEYHLYKGNK